MKILVDLDGVIVKDKEFNLFEDTKEFMDFIKNKDFVILSNNSTRAPEQILEILRSKGLDLKNDKLITPLIVLPEIFKKYDIRSAFIIGSDMLKAYVSKFINIENDIYVDAVIVGQDKALDFKKIKTAISAVFLNGAKIIPINHSKIVKDSDGLYFQGSGSLAFMIAYATDYKEELPNLGKPSKLFFSKILNEEDYKNSIIISDDFQTDLIGAKALGLKTIFITTGKYKREDLYKSKFEPDFVVDSLKELEVVLSNLGI